MASWYKKNAKSRSNQLARMLHDNLVQSGNIEENEWTLWEDKEFKCGEPREGHPWRVMKFKGMEDFKPWYKKSNKKSMDFSPASSTMGRVGVEMV